ncbi:MAG: hypothetical protein ABIH24_10235 [Verrucomicrobiota bacterium]
MLHVTRPVSIIYAVRIATPAAYRTPTHTQTPPACDRPFSSSDTALK